MPTGTLMTVLSIDGKTISRSAAQTADHVGNWEVPLPHGVGGALTTRTDDNTGVFTSASHGLTNSVAVDVFWDAGGCRYAMAVSSYDTNTVTVDGGAGDNLPTENAAITVTPRVQINTAIDGDSLKMVGISLETSDQSINTSGHADLQNTAGDTVLAIELTANYPWDWDAGSGETNGLAGNAAATCYAANGNNTTNATLKIITLEDSTP